jgi:hypothetical protein
MNKKSINCLALALALLLTGCWQKSVHPFYQAKDLTFDPALAGTWAKNAEDKEKWTFTGVEGKSYLLVIEEEKGKHEFDARLFKLGTDRFLDLHSRQRTLKRTLSNIPAHHLLRIRTEDDELHLESLSFEWVRKSIEANASAISHIRVNDPDDPSNYEIVLTAPTEALQKFIRENLAKEGFFDKGDPLKKVSAKP